MCRILKIVFLYCILKYKLCENEIVAYIIRFGYGCVNPLSTMFQFDHGGKKNVYPEKITHLPQFTVLIKLHPVYIVTGSNRT